MTKEEFESELYKIKGFPWFSIYGYNEVDCIKIDGEFYFDQLEKFYLLWKKYGEEVNG
jgi:hypothetical protein